MSDDALIIYYFTGTGNSLIIARDIATGLGGEVVPMYPLVVRGEKVRPKGKIGLVFPTHAFGLPVAVPKFIQLLDLSEVSYVFGVNTRSMMTGEARKQFLRLMEQQGHRPESFFAVNMPNNYVPFFDIYGQSKVEKTLAKADRKVRMIVSVVGNDGRANDARTSGLLSGRLHQTFEQGLPEMTRNFWVDQNCNSCGLCVELCPSLNIQLTAGSPTWGSKCLQCLMCLHLCPQKAIQYGKKSASRGRYHHPRVTIEDLKKQRP